MEAQHLFENILQREPGYIGSYYHLAKLLERTGNIEQAIRWYEKKEWSGQNKKVRTKHMVSCEVLMKS